MESPPPAVFHDKAKRTQQGNVLDTLSPHNIEISIFLSHSKNSIDRSHFAMEGGPVSAKICLTGIFLWIDPPQFRHNFFGRFWEKAPFLSSSHLKRKSLLGSEILKAIETPYILSEIITITSVINSSVVWRKRTRLFSSGCFLIFPTYWKYICCVKVVLHFLSRHVARQ